MRYLQPAKVCCHDIRIMPGVNNNALCIQAICPWCRLGFLDQVFNITGFGPCRAPKALQTDMGLHRTSSVRSEGED